MKISEAAKRAGKRFFEAMEGTNPNYDICEIVQQAIDEATAERDAEIDRLKWSEHLLFQLAQCMGYCRYVSKNLPDTFDDQIYDAVFKYFNDREAAREGE